MARLGRIPGTDLFRNLDRFDQLEERADTLVVRVDGPLYYANVDYVKKQMDRWAASKGEDLSKIIFDAHTLTSLDSSAVQALQEWILEWHRHHYQVYICGAKGPVRDVLDRWNIFKLVGTEYTYITADQAMDQIEGILPKKEKKKSDPYTFQSNEPDD